MKTAINPDSTGKKSWLTEKEFVSTIASCAVLAVQWFSGGFAALDQGQVMFVATNIAWCASSAAGLAMRIIHKYRSANVQ